MARRKNLPEPVAKLRSERAWPKGVPMPTPGSYHAGDVWSYEDEEQLRTYYQEYGARYVARLLGRSRNAVVTRAGLLGVDRGIPRWSAEDVERLKQVYGTVSMAELARRFGRPEARIRDKARELGLTNAPKPLTADVVWRIVRGMGKTPLFDLARELGISLRRAGEIARANGYNAPGSRPRRPWTSEDDDFLTANHAGMPAIEMSQRMGRTPTMVEARAIVLGLSLDHTYPQFREWTKREDALLRKLVPTMTRSEIAARLQRSVSAVKSRAAILGLKHAGVKAPRRMWTPAEDALLRRLAPTVERREIARRVGRKLWAIEQRAKALGVKLRWSGPEHWTAEENATLRRLAKSHGRSEIAELMGYSEESISGRLQRLGLTKKRTTEHRPWSEKEDRLLLELIDTLGRKGTAEKLGRSVHSVAVRSGRLRRGDGRLKPWTDKEDRLLAKLYGKIPIEQIAVQLGRSAGSVAIRATSGNPGIPGLAPSSGTTAASGRKAVAPAENAAASGTKAGALAAKPAASGMKSGPSGKKAAVSGKTAASTKAPAPGNVATSTKAASKKATSKKAAASTRRTAAPEKASTSGKKIVASTTKAGTSGAKAAASKKAVAPAKAAASKKVAASAGTSAAAAATRRPGTSKQSGAAGKRTRRR